VPSLPGGGWTALAKCGDRPTLAAMRSTYRLNRRMFLADLGKGTLAVAILGTGVAACGGDDDDDQAAATTSSSTATTRGNTSTSGDKSGAAGDLEWERVSLGFVSAYVLTRGNEVAVVDTGTSGSEGQIEEGISAAGFGWGDVRHVILTHRHPDHIGSTAAVLEAAAKATGYAAEPDIGSVDSPRPLKAVADGDDVFGLQVIGTPGHTPGHISVLDQGTGLLVAGDALIGENGKVGGPNPQFSSDHDQAEDSVKKLAQLQFETVVFGHGDPVESGAATQVKDLAATL
jgi:glyoxylase-like metal-dependent hydrolase (beta-lactamase superfamily II)